MKKTLLILITLTLSLNANDEIDPTDMPQDMLTRSPVTQKTSLVTKRKTHKDSQEHSVAPSKLRETIDQLFDKYLKAADLNPACVEQLLGNQLTKAKDCLEKKLNAQLDNSYRSQHLFKNIDDLVKEFFKIFIVQAKFALRRAWVLSVIEDAEKNNSAKPTSHIRLSKKTNDFYQKMTASRARGK